MLSLITVALAFSVRDAKPAAASALRLRGGISAGEAQKYIGYLTVASSAVGYVYTNEMADKYEPTEKLTPQTTAMGRMNFGVQLAAGVLLLKPDAFVPTLAAVFYSMASQFGETFQMPRYPMVAWAAILPALQWAAGEGKVPEWALGGFLLANGLFGSFMWETCYSLYQTKVALNKQASSMGQFVNSGLAATGLYLLGPTLGWSDTQAVAGFLAAFAAGVLKFVLVDGEGMFNPMGGYAWAAIMAAGAFLNYQA